MRPRGDTWRIALRGIHRLSLPPLTASTHRGHDRLLDTTWGRFQIQTEVTTGRGHSGPSSYTWDSSPSLDAARPYPRTGITWTPDPPRRPLSP